MMLLSNLQRYLWLEKARVVVFTIYKEERVLSTLYGIHVHPTEQMYHE